MPAPEFVTITGGDVADGWPAINPDKVVAAFNYGSNTESPVLRSVTFGANQPGGQTQEPSAFSLNYGSSSDDLAVATLLNSRVLSVSDEDDLVLPVITHLQNAWYKTSFFFHDETDDRETSLYVNAHRIAQRFIPQRSNVRGVNYSCVW